MEFCKTGFIYLPTHLDRNGRALSVEEAPNIVPTVGLDYLVNAALFGDAQFTTWYLGLFNNNWSPVAGDTMTTLIASAGENQAYTGTARQAIPFPAVAAGETNTIDTPNIFEFATAQTIRGGFITTSPTWGGTTGLLISAVLFPSPKVMLAGESLKVPVGFGLQSA
jgi:hypothetical protein